MVQILLLLFDADFKECNQIIIVTVIEKISKKIFTIIYTHKIPTYNIRSKIRVLVTVRTYFWTN